MPTPNDYEIHSHSSYADLFNQEVPDKVEGFECGDREKMKVIWPEGHGAAAEVRHEGRRTFNELIHIYVGVGAVLAHQVEGFPIRRLKSTRRGGGILREGFSCAGIQGQT